jgi:hypothetical protein
MNEIERRRRHPNRRSGLLEKLKLLENLTKSHRTSLPLTAGHRGRRRWGGERPDLEGKGTLKEVRPRRVSRHRGSSQTIRCQFFGLFAEETIILVHSDSLVLQTLSFANLLQRSNLDSQYYWWIGGLFTCYFFFKTFVASIILGTKQR